MPLPPLTVDSLIQVYKKQRKHPSTLYDTTAISDSYKSKKNTFFTRFSHGIQLTSAMWYSVCPEYFALTIADVITAQLKGTGCILDAFGGAGGQAIGLATRGHTVHSLEYDEIHCKLIRENAAVYGVSGLVYAVCCDVFTQTISYCLCNGNLRKYDCVILSPPWGGPGYWQHGDINMFRMKIGSYTGSQMVSLMCRLIDLGVSTRFVLHMPRNTTDESIYRAGARVRKHVQRQNKHLQGCVQPMSSTTVVTEMQLNGRVNFLAIYIGCWDREAIVSNDRLSIQFTHQDDHSSTALCDQFL